MGSGGVAIAALPTVICLKVPFSDGLGGGYSLTPIAKDFLREISYVIEWGQLHFEQIVKGRK